MSAPKSDEQQLWFFDRLGDEIEILSGIVPVCNVAAAIEHAVKHCSVASPFP